MGLVRRGRSALVLGALFTVAMLPGCASSNDGSSGSSQSPIRHIVIVVKENHSFDNYFNSLETPPRQLPHCASMTEASDCEYHPDVFSDAQFSPNTFTISINLYPI